MSDRPCTCHPDDNPPVPCPQKFALSECKAAAPAPDAKEENLATMARIGALRCEGGPHSPTGFLLRQLADEFDRLTAAPAPELVAYCPAYELERLKAGHDASVRSSRFGPSQLDGDVPLYTHPVAAPAPDALENCRLYAARHRKEEWAQTILRFCAEGGAKGSPLRDTPAAPAPRELTIDEQRAMDAALMASVKPVAAPDADAIMKLADEWYSHGQMSHTGIDEKYASLRAAVERLVRENERLDRYCADVNRGIEQITVDRDAKTKRMWELGHECDALQERAESAEQEVRDKEDALRVVAAESLRRLDRAIAAEKKAVELRKVLSATRAKVLELHYMHPEYELRRTIIEPIDAACE